MREKTKIIIPLRMVLFGLTVFFVALIGVSLIRGETIRSTQSFLGSVFLPMQKGINLAGGVVVNTYGNVSSLASTSKENKELKEQVEQLQEEVNMLQQDKYQIKTYEELLDLKESYPDYDMVGAHVIGKDSGNWFHNFTIDKGTNDGIKEDMVVLAQGGLAGIVTSAGKNSSKVMAIIDDSSNVTAMKNSSNSKKVGCMVAGDLELYKEGKLRIMYIDKDAEVNTGDTIVTSNVSTKYVGGILIGYVDEVTVDANNMSKSGTLVPAVDFDHLDTVLVITTLKDTGKNTEE
ncbi:Rod shape-determining protein MreC [Lachnospiraceae bacterium TWA4]|nr:Rod shape-determining protein MreC [Lachnospiraceae bacterium TWA4]